MTIADEMSEPDRRLSRPELFTLFGALMLTMLLAALDQTIVGTALPTIVGDLQGMSNYTWVVTAYLIATTASAPLYGKMSDLFGRRPIILLAITVFLAASAVAGMAQSMLELVIFRGMQGLGAGGLMTLAFTIVSDVLPPRRRGKYQGLFGAVFAVASVVGPVLGGWLAEIGWRWIFYINIPTGLIALIAINQVLRRHEIATRRRSIDYLGSACLVPAVVCLLLGTTWGGQTYPWSSGVIIGLFAAAAVLGIVFLNVESRAEEPILPLRMFRDSTFSLASAMALVFGISMFSGIVYIPLFFQMVRGYAPTTSGLLMLPMMGGLLLASSGSGLAISKLGRYKGFLVVGSVVTTIGLSLFTQLHLNTSLTVSGIYMLVLGAGMGMIMQPLVLAIQNTVSSRERGTATSTNTFSRTLGGAAGTAMLGAVLNHRLNGELAANLPGTIARLSPAEATGLHSGDLSHVMESPTVVHSLPDPVKELVQQAFTHGLDNVFIVAAVIAGISIALALLMPNRELRDGPTPTR